MDGPDRIRFSVAKPYWNELAAYLDPPSYNVLNNWEGLAEELEFKLREIEHIRHIRHESGSNTIIMFNQYVNKTNGGDLHQVLRALDKLKRLDAFQVLRNKYEDIKARNMREYGPEPMVTTPPQPMVTTPPQPMFTTPPQPMVTTPSSQVQQDIILQQQRKIQELQLQQQQYSLLISGQPRNLRPPAPPVPLNMQAMYTPVRQQIPQHMWQSWLEVEAEQRRQAQQHPHQVQETPMNLKKPSPPLNGPIDLYQNFNRRTDKDFPLGFADQFKPHSPDSNTSLEAQMDSLQSVNQSWGVHSMPFSGPKEYPAEFTEVLGRGENNLASLTPEPMVIAPIPDRPTKPTLGGSHRADLMDFSVSNKTILAQSDLHFAVYQSATNTRLPQQQTSFRHLSDESYLSRPQACYTRLPSGGLVRDTHPLVVSQAPPSIIPHGVCPIGHIRIKQEKTEDTKPMEVVDAFSDHLKAGVTPQLHHQQRESVIQAGPQCNSLPTASPGDISQMSSPGTVKDEEDTDQRANSLEERPTQKLYGKHLRPKRFTWPLASKELKERNEPPKPEPPKPVSISVQAQSCSVDRNYKQPPFKKKPVKVLLTYTFGTKDVKNHKKELTVLYNCLVKNDFLPSLDFKEDQEFNRDMQRWIDTRFREANFVIVCISPQYKKDIEHHDDQSQTPQTRHSRCCRYIYNLMQNEFVHQGSHNKRFLPVLFPGSTHEDIPMWMRSIVAFRWREHWRDIMYMMLEPKDIIVKIKGNKERFTEQEEAPIIRMTQSCS